jgi:hypothetical protein
MLVPRTQGGAKQLHHYGSTFSRLGFDILKTHPVMKPKGARVWRLKIHFTRDPFASCRPGQIKDMFVELGSRALPPE